MKEAARSIVTRTSCLKKGSNALIICGRHNSAFAEDLMQECYAEHASPHMWVFDENLLKSANIPEDLEIKLPEHTRSLLQNSEVVIWLTQYENPKTAPDDLGKAICAFWDQVYGTVKGKPLLLVSLLSAKSVETMGIGHEEYLMGFAEAVNVDYDRIRRTGLEIAAIVEKGELIHVIDPNGTDLTFSIKNRRVGIEVGTLEDCFSTGRECEVEIPAGEVYVAPVENSAYGTLVANELRDFDVERLVMKFEEGRVVSYEAEKGEASFHELLEKASGDKDRIAELGIGTNYGMKPIGLRIYDEKALGTAHVAIGDNVHLGGTSNASIHIDFVLYEPTIRADNRVVMEHGQVVENSSTRNASG